MAEIPQAEVDYQFAHKDAYNAQGLNAFNIIGTLVCIVIVGLRLWARASQKISWKADDYVIVVSLIVTIASGINYLIKGYAFGFGHHYLTLSPSVQQGFTKTDYAYNILYSIGYSSSKVSITLLYRRIFVLTWFRLCCWILIFIFSGYGIATALVNIWLTIPIRAYWDHSIKASHRVNEVALYKTNAIFNIITDSMLLLLPLSVVWRLQMSTPKKIGTTFVFCVGILTVIASIMRLILFFRVNIYDSSWTLTPLAFWTAGEQYLGIICACLPCLLPLVRLGWFRYGSRSGLDHTPSPPRTFFGENKTSNRSRFPLTQIRKKNSDDKALLKKPESTITTPARTIASEKDVATPLKSLDPRFMGAGMGTMTDAHSDHERGRDGRQARDEEEGLPPLPSNAIEVAKGFQVEKK